MGIPSLYSGLAQVIVVGVLAFCGPGLFNAMQGLGGAGNENPEFANAANATLYATFAVFGYFGAVAFNLFGNKVLMFVGGLTYAVYAATQYLAGNYANWGWISPVGGAILGFGAGWFWTSQGAMILAYSTPLSRGQYIAIFWVIFNLGGMIGGFITFGVNYHTEVATANAATYFTFIALMVGGAFMSLVLLVPPGKVRRADNEMVVFEKATGGVLDEVKGALAVALDSNMALLLVLFISSNFFYTYQFNGVNGLLFSMRTRGLNSALYWGSQMLGSVIMSKVLDKKEWGLKRRGFYGLLLLVVEFNFTYAIGAYLQMGFEGGYDKDNKPEIPIDFTDSSRCWFPMITFFLYAIGDSFLQTFAYWLMAALAKGDTTLCARYAGFYKGVQSAGAAIAWGIDLSENMSYVAQFWLNWGLFIASLVGTTICCRRLEEHEEVKPTAIELAKSIAASEESSPFAVVDAVVDERNAVSSRSSDSSVSHSEG